MNTHCLNKITLAFSMLMLFSANLSASDLFEDVIFHVEANTQNATEPRMKCADVTPQNFRIKLNATGKAVVNSQKFGAATNPDCNYAFSMDNDGTMEPDLTFIQAGIQDAYFYVKGHTANATPMGACPFDVNVLPARYRRVNKVQRF